jgi:acyl-CoA reductase-like NAD-dependent aldehyde dehydrogenase
VGAGPVSESVNPATGAVLGQWADGGEAEARAAVAAARRAFGTSPWPRDRGLRHRVLSGPLAITEFTEAKTVVHSIPPFQV